MFLRFIAALLLGGFHINFAQAQAPKTKNIVIITLDGLRWQEVFEGADL